MEVFIDNKQIEHDFADDTSVEDAVRHVQDEVCSSDRMVIQLRCDGCDVESNAMTELMGKPISNIDRLDILTGTKGELVRDAMTEAAQSLENTSQECERVAAMLNEGKTDPAIKVLGECLSVWQQIHEAVAKSIEMLSLDLDTVMIQDESLATVVGKPKHVLIQVKEALEKRDYVLLADVLQYEFHDVTERWQSVVAELQKRAIESA